MKTPFITDAEVELEIDRLSKSPMVALAKKEQAIKYKRRQYLYKLRGLEKRGQELAEKGIDLDSLECFGDEYDADNI